MRRDPQLICVGVPQDRCRILDILALELVSRVQELNLPLSTSLQAARALLQKGYPLAKDHAEDAALLVAMVDALQKFHPGPAEAATQHRWSIAHASGGCDGSCHPMDFTHSDVVSAFVDRTPDAVWSSSSALCTPSSFVCENPVFETRGSSTDRQDGTRRLLKDNAIRRRWARTKAGPVQEGQPRRRPFGVLDMNRRMPFDLTPYALTLGLPSH